MRPDLSLIRIYTTNPLCGDLFPVNILIGVVGGFYVKTTMLLEHGGITIISNQLAK
jgi:hypothetical protein